MKDKYTIQNRTTIEISVIMPIYSDKEYLKDSIESIINQDFKDFEFIIVNDGASKEISNIIEKYKLEDERIKIIYHNDNQGLAKSVNDALKIAKGKYIARMDGDDISLIKRLSKQKEFLDKHTDIDIVGSSVEKINQNGDTISIYTPPFTTEDINASLEKYNPMVHPSIMFRNNKGIVYREKFLAVQDYDLFLRIKDSNQKMANMRDVLLKYRISNKHSDIGRMLKHSSYHLLALDLHKERVTNGFDSYDSFDSTKFENLTVENIADSRVLEQLLFSFYKNKENKMLSKYVRTYIKRFGLSFKLIKTMLIYGTKNLIKTILKT